MSAVDVRGAVVGYVTAMWQDQPLVAYEILQDACREGKAGGVSNEQVVMEVIDAMSDMVLSVVASFAHAGGQNCQDVIANTLQMFGRVATGD